MMAVTLKIRATVLLLKASYFFRGVRGIAYAMEGITLP
jgi:hypothetical protein